MSAETVICKLRETRTDLGFTQRQVADGSDMNVRTLINIETGKTIPSLLYAMKLANFLNLPVAQLFEYKMPICHQMKEKTAMKSNTTINFKTIAVDFDGTLCYSKWPELGQPNQALIEYLHEWKRNGNKLILWTCRAGEALSKAVEWCREQNLEFDAVNDNLPEIIEF